MIETSSLADLKILSGIKLVVADIDYTLTNFPVSHNAAIKELGNKFGIEFSKRVNDIFSLIEEEHKHKDPENWEKNDEFKALINEMSDIEKDSIEKYGVKRWSRESWMILASGKLNLNLTSKDIEEARDLYWTTHSRLTSVYEDAKIFLNNLTQLKIPLILMTSSDSAMKIQKNLSLVYNPEFSKTYKMKRMKMLPFSYNSLIIGDPVDKPSQEFFNLVYEQMNKLGIFDKKSILFIGDSFSSDLKTPLENGYSGLLIRR